MTYMAHGYGRQCTARNVGEVKNAAVFIFTAPKRYKQDQNGKVKWFAR